MSYGICVNIDGYMVYEASHASRLVRIIAKCTIEIAKCTIDSRIRPPGYDLYEYSCH